MWRPHKTLLLHAILLLLLHSMGGGYPMKMTARKPMFLNIPNGPKLAYHRSFSNEKPGGVLFLNGFRSSMDGNKALALEEFCHSHLKIGFTRFDYRGHGASSGNHPPFAVFENLGLSDWIADARAMLQDCVQAQGFPQILVGSSMGAWIALHLALEQEPKFVAGILGIAAAPDFTVDLWKGLTNLQKEELLKNQRVLLPSEYSQEPYPISQYLLDDAQKWLLLETPQSTTTTPMNRIDIHCPVRLIHGQNDVDVSWKKSLQLLESIASKDVQVTIIKSGDHRLSTPKDLNTICRVLEELVCTVT